MRLHVEDDEGNRTMMLLTGTTTVLGIKQHVERALGVPAGQQALLFAGRDLADGRCAVKDLGLDSYNTQQEVTLHVRRRLADPRSVWLCMAAGPGGGPGGERRQHLEAIEAGSSMGQVMRLLAVRGLAEVPFAPAQCSGDVVVRRQDGTSTRLAVGSDETIAQLEARIEQAEGARPKSLSFMQAPDGCLHVVFGPSHGDEGAGSFYVYSRPAAPQPAMAAKQVGPGQETLGDLARRLCVNP